MVDFNNVIKLLDFGLAARTRYNNVSNNYEAVTSRPFRNWGTPVFMPKESLDDNNSVTYASDVWLLGCIFIYCFLKRYLWNDIN